MATNVLLFAGLDKNGDNNLWVTDGTAAGTSEISVAGVGSEGLFGLPPASPYFAASPDGRVLFSGIDAKGDFNLWVTNGTSAGTSEISLAKQDPNGLIPQNLTVFGNKVLFEGLDKNLNSNLWVTDGTAAGTSELSVNGQNTQNFVPQDFTVLGSKVLFNGQDNKNISTGDYDLWVTNGTAAGTSEISVPASEVSPVIGLDPQDLVTFGSEVLFRGLDLSNLWGLWVTDGTVHGTSELVSHGSSFEPDDLTVFGDKVLFNSFDASDRVNLWVTDGTAAGTSELSVANVDTNDFDFGLLPQHFFVFGSEVLFSGEDANQLTGLWVTDGTSVGTSEISVAGANTSFGLEPFGFALLGSEVLFNGTDALSQQNLWVTDGTSAGTSELSVAHAASVGAGFSRPVVFSSGGSSEVLYASADLNNLGGLWVTDGTTAGTSELSVAGLGPAQGSPGDFIAFGSLFLFEGADANGHFNLWQTDGTAGGTSEISVPGASSLGLFDEQSSDVHIVPFGSEVLFAGNDSSGRNNLWVTDGTLASTSELSATGADATDGLFPRSLTLFGSEVLFSGLDTAQRTGLWVTNGTSAGTSELSVAHSQLFSQGVDNLTVLGSKVLFVATDVNFNSTLWVTDGTGAGTSELSVPNSEAFSGGQLAG
jgi:ELWxxDGT repeat protein